MESKYIYVILLRNSISEKIFIIIPREMSEAVKCLRFVVQFVKENHPSVTQVLRKPSETLSY